MLSSSSDTELVAAWRALSGLATGDGWKVIELFSIGNCCVMAGRRGVRNEESVLVGVKGNVPSQPFHLPRGQGFSLISTELQDHSAGHSWFALVRQESGSLGLFTKVAADLVNLIESTSAQDGLRIHSAMISRIRAWQAFMKRDSDGVLSTEEEIGLFGELLVLQNLLDDGVSEFDALDSWAGPDDGLHDFLLGVGAIEVKTTLAPAGFIARISNLDQLDDSLHQPLFVAAVRLTQLNGGSTLPDLIDQVAGRIHDPGASALLNSRLVSAGYMDMTRAEYTRRFRSSELTYRIVGADSPRLIRSSVPAAIHEARYSLDLDAFPIAASTYADISTSPWSEESMELTDFLSQIRAEVQDEIEDRMSVSGAAYPYPELVFAEITMRHMEEVGMTYEPQVCHVDTRVHVGNIRLSGYSISEDGERLDLFVTSYKDSDRVQAVPDSEAKQAAEYCFRFLSQSAQGKMTKTLDPSNDAYELAVHIERGYRDFEEIRIYVLTDGQVKTKNFKSQEVGGRTVRLEVMDIERLNRHLSEGKPRDELVVNFAEVAGTPLPCVYIRGEEDSYDYAMTVFPADVLRHLYDKYGARLLEANVRSFLSATGKVNKGIQSTLRSEPEKFVAYNNGIVVVADEVSLGKTSDGGPGIAWLKGMQIVNGGQTTASIYFTKKKFADTDLSKVQVPAKVVILKTENSAAEEALISDISRFANSQNTVKQSDLSANSPFHVELEKLSDTVYLPDGVGRWFYERASGSYNTKLAREGSTPAKYRALKTTVIPPARRLVKTDLAKFLNSWDGRPDQASLGGQKNFARFMDDVKEREERGESGAPDATGFKQMIAKVIIFKQVQSLVRPLLPAFQGNVAIYLVALLSQQHGSRIDLMRVWEQQGLSDGFKDQIRTWAKEVNVALHASAKGKMISEWAKKEECWLALQTIKLSPIRTKISEIN